MSDKPEFRLYYDNTGKVLFYTGDSPPGNFIVIDAMTFAESNPYVRVVDGIIVREAVGSVVTILTQDPEEGQKCAAEDMSIIADDTTTNTIKWKMTTHEL